MRVVLDTIVYVRALLNPKGRRGRLVFDTAQQHVVVVSPDIVREVIEVLYRPELREKLPRLEFSARLEAILSILEGVEVVEPKDCPLVCRDPDDKFFWCAVAASADYIISEDRDILDVGNYRGIHAISAAVFERILGRG